MRYIDKQAFKMAKRHCKLISIKHKHTGKRQQLAAHYASLDDKLHMYLKIANVTDEFGNGDVSRLMKSIQHTHSQIANLLSKSNTEFNSTQASELVHLQDIARLLEHELLKITHKGSHKPINEIIRDIALIETERNSLRLKICKQHSKCKYLDLIERLINPSKIKPAYLNLIYSLALITRLIAQIILKPTYSSLEKFKPSIIRLSKGYNVNTPPAAPPRAFNLCNQIFHTVFEGTYYAHSTFTRS